VSKPFQYVISQHKNGSVDFTIHPEEDSSFYEDFPGEENVTANGNVVWKRLELGPIEITVFKP